MKVFIFGAGASLGSQFPPIQPGSEQRAPLVNELFNMEYCGYAKPFLTNVELLDCRDKSREARSVENWLTDRWERVGQVKLPLAQQYERELFGRLSFYIWNLTRAVSWTYSEENYYAQLLRKLRIMGEEFSLISFNYDTLLDQAFDKNLVTLMTFDDYLKYKLLRNHLT